jgi:hypothetical protein
MNLSDPVVDFVPLATNAGFNTASNAMEFYSPNSFAAFLVASGCFGLYGLW